MIHRSSGSHNATPTVLHGQVRGLSRQRETANFFFTSSDQTAMGGIAVAAAAAGLGAQAVGTAMAASDLEETADYLSFWIGDQRCKGWVWRSPIREGDMVEVVGSPGADHFELCAVVRSRDRMIALYPHMSRGRKAHWTNALKLWAYGTLIVSAAFYICALVMAVISSGMSEASDISYHLILISVCLAGGLFFLVMTFFLARRWMKFVLPAEQIFAALGWGDPEQIDLIKSSNRQRLATDNIMEYGVFYFRY
jgi:hypothetical protein